MNTTRHDFRLNFNSDLGAVMTLNIPHAKQNATGTEIAAAMDAIINSGIVMSVQGKPQTKHSAELVATTSKKYNVS